MRIAELVKTYKLINDPNSPGWSIRFVGAIAGVGILLVVAAALFTAGGHEYEETNAPLATSRDNGDGTRTDYVGLDPDSFSATVRFDREDVEALWDAWVAEHPDARVLSKEPRWVGAHVIGYDVRYAP